jgi:signal transduction histidine kinase
LQVADNGIGLRADAVTEGSGRRRGGRGMDNMRSRAATIGASLHTDAGPDGGVCITLELKVGQGAAPLNALSRPLDLV